MLTLIIEGSRVFFRNCYKDLLNQELMEFLHFNYIKLDHAIAATRD